MNKIFTFLVFVILLAAIIVGVKFGKTTANNSLQASTSKSTSPNYSLVFPNDKVNRIDITVSKKQWAQMNENIVPDAKLTNRRPRPQTEGLTEGQNLGRENHPPRPPGATNLIRENGMANDSIRHAKHGRRQGPPPGMHAGGPMEGSKPEATWSYCDLNFNNKKWSKVGIRFKGNSSLRTTAERGLKKFSFKLDFDEFEDQFPEIKNQRFYGFKQLNLKNNFNDPSLIREKVAADLFTEFGLTSPKTSFCQVFVDYGEGPQYFGLYTLVEEVDDTVIKTQYKGQDGNLYKPEGRASTFASGSFNEVSMNKKSNKKSKDFTDVQQLNEVVNSSLRTSDYQEWKSQLSTIFDIDVFLKWLAANEVMQNWDTYGNTTHNYYLYNNTDSGKLEWIPWDNNEALEHGKMGGALPLSLNTVGDNWPLIRYVVDDEEWRTEYQNYVADFANTVFTPEKMTQVYDNYQQLISTYVVGKQGEQKDYSFLKDDNDFNDAFAFLKSHVYERQTLVHEFMQEQNF